MSPAVNDPGTAIQVIAGLTHVLTRWADLSQSAKVRDNPYPGVLLPPISAAEIFDNAFMALSRDGAGHLEVAMHLKSALAGLARLDSSYPGLGFRQQALRLVSDLETFAQAAMPEGEHLKRLKAHSPVA